MSPDTALLIGAAIAAALTMLPAVCCAMIARHYSRIARNAAFVASVHRADCSLIEKRITVQVGRGRVGPDPFL